MPPSRPARVPAIAAWLAAFPIPAALAAAPPLSIPGEPAAASRLLSDRNLALGGLRFADPGTYDAFDQDGDPLGLLEDPGSGYGLGARFLGSSLSGGGLKVADYRNLLPVFSIRQPGTFALLASYQPDLDRAYAPADPGPAQRVRTTRDAFAVDLAAGTEGRLVQFGLSLDGGWAKASDGTGDVRWRLFADRLQASAGSRPQPWLGFGAHLGTALLVDTLRAAGGSLDRYAMADFPRYGFFLDLGDSAGLGPAALPVFADLSADFGKERLLGAYRPAGQDSRDYHPVWTPEYAWSGRVTFLWRYGDITLGPALSADAWGRDARAYGVPEGDAKHSPFQAGSPVPGSAYSLSGTGWGLGTSAGYGRYGTAYLEWGPERVEAKDTGKAERGGARLALGLEAALHAWPQLRLPADDEVYLRLGYASGREVPPWTAFRPGASDRADPGFAANSLRDLAPSPPPLSGAWSAWSAGLGLGLWKRLLRADAHLGLVDRDWLWRPTRNAAGLSGLEWGAELAYSLRGPGAPQ